MVANPRESDGDRTRLILAGMIAALCAFAWLSRWVQDDAYITFRYSSNLVSGLGPVWNRGYAVEGYTNFSWMILVAALMRLGVSAETASAVLGVPCLAGSLFFVYRLARALLPDERWALLATFAVGTNYSFLMYATGGLETQLQALLALGTLSLTVDAMTREDDLGWLAAGVSGFVALALMTRPDAVVLGAVAFAFVGLSIVRVARTQPAPAATIGRGLAGLFLPVALIIVPWLVWKLSFYGRILPNTYYVKLGVHRPLTFVRGVIYVAWPFLTFWWLPVWGYILWKYRKIPGHNFFISPPIQPLVAYAVLWVSYAIWTGGDIMEFRQLVSVIPVLLLLLLRALAAVTKSIRTIAAVVAFLFCGSIMHGLFFPRYVTPEGINSIPVLAEVGGDPGENWVAMGKTLHELFGSESRVTIAVSPAGAIPYYSALRTIDVLGLNDLEVPKQGLVRVNCRICTAHPRVATINYLNQMGTNLLIAHPQLLRPGEKPPTVEDVLKRMYYLEEIDREHLPKTARLVGIALPSGSKLLAVYLNPTPEVDALIERGQLHVF